MAMRALAVTVAAALLATGCHGATPGARATPATTSSAPPTVAAVVLHSDPPVSEVPADPDPAALRGEVYSAKAAANRAHDLLGYLQLPKGAIPVPDPSGPTGRPPRDVPARNLVSRSRWWSWSGTVSAALRYLHKHEPVGLVLRQRSTNTAGLSRVYFTLLQQPPYHATVTVFLVRTPGHVVFRVDGQVTWLPHRAAAEFVPFSTPVVELTAMPVSAGAKGLPRRHVQLRGPEPVQAGAMVRLQRARGARPAAMRRGRRTP